MCGKLNTPSIEFMKMTEIWVQNSVIQSYFNIWIVWTNRDKTVTGTQTWCLTWRGLWRTQRGRSTSRGSPCVRLWPGMMSPSWQSPAQTPCMTSGTRSLWSWLAGSTQEKPRVHLSWRAFCITLLVKRTELIMRLCVFLQESKYFYELRHHLNNVS